MNAGRSVLLVVMLALPDAALLAQPPAPAAPAVSAAPGTAAPPALNVPTRPRQRPTGKAGAQADLAGYWTSVVSEDWRWRMVTPLKGDFSNIPLNADGQQVGEGWDPARDEAAGEQCKAYAAPAIMREPEHLHIYWQDDQTLRIETDSGMQTRLLHFAAADPGAPSWQGYSAAEWEGPVRGLYPPGVPLGLSARGGTHSKALEVVTTHIRPGYLRKNGVPFSASAKLTEYYDLFKDPDGVDWFVVTSIVEDPVYLNAPWVTTSHFKRLKDGTLWHPTPCAAR